MRPLLVGAIVIAAFIPQLPASSEPGCVVLGNGTIRCGGEVTGGGGGSGGGGRSPGGGGGGGSGRGGGGGGGGGSEAGGGHGVVVHPACLRDVFVIRRPDECFIEVPPPAPGDPTAPDAAPDPAVVAAGLATSFWHEVSLPRPGAHIAPGWAITGKRAYLEIDTPLDRRFERPTPLGPLVIVARATLTVDWGDGSRTGPIRSTGGPWPQGDLTHTYESSGTVDVIVRAAWTASWSIGPYSGTLDGLTMSGAIAGLRVREVQGFRTT